MATPIQRKTKPGERCRELVNAADEMTRRLYNVIGWMFEYPDYNPKTKVIPKRTTLL